MTFVLVAAMIVYKRKKEGKKERKFCRIQNEYKPIETLSCSLSSCTRENKLLRRRGKKNPFKVHFPPSKKRRIFTKMLLDSVIHMSIITDLLPLRDFPSNQSFSFFLIVIYLSWPRFVTHLKVMTFTKSRIIVACQPRKVRTLRSILWCWCAFRQL